MSNIRWTASIEFWFDCPECGLRVLEGNPRACPHQTGRRMLYNPMVHGRVENWQYILRQMGMEWDPPTPSPAAPRTMTTEEVVLASCPKGT